MSKYLNIALVIGVLILAGSIIIKPQGKVTESPKPEEKVLGTQKETQPMERANDKQYQKAEQVTKAGKTYTAVMHTTAGDMTIELSKDTPVTTNNFVFLAKDGYYDNVIFHRTIPGFMIQGGDPTGTGMGNPGYKFADEKFNGEYKKGTLAMANSGPNTNGSQFFIMHADYALPKNYVIFGHVTEGLDVIDKIATAPTIKDGMENSKPQNPVKITSVEITEK